MMGGQMVLAGIEAAAPARSVRCCDLSAGSAVRYLGRVHGGPRFGSCGTVRRPLARSAVVEMDGVGTWHIPYYLLTSMEGT